MTSDILIVDDSAVIRQAVRKSLQMAGLDFGDVYEAGNGIQALAQLASHEVAVMLVDINMPRMNGIQLLTRMKQNRLLQHIPIVVVSTEGSDERVKELKQMGAFGFVRKPFKPEQLRDVLVPLLGVKKHADTSSINADDSVF